MKPLLTILIFVLLAATLPAEQPNIVFILADDMGYGDLGCYGHPEAKTPVIDQLARDGVRFSQHYANGPECSPTRTAFLTGRYQQRAGGLECAIGTGNVGRYDDAIRLAKARQLGLPAKQVVLPSALKKTGYASGVFGKWHLGYEPQFNPLEHGWDDFFGYMGGNVHYFTHRELSDLHVLYRGRLPVYEEVYMTHLITDSSLDFIERNKDRPFFLFISHETPHFPFQGPGDAKKMVDKSNWTEPNAKTYVAMLEDLDSEVGPQGSTPDVDPAAGADRGGWGFSVAGGPIPVPVRLQAPSDYGGYPPDPGVGGVQERSRIWRPSSAAAVSRNIPIDLDVHFFTC